MRTIKALVCAAALAAGLATSLAQSNVYSLNVVGYYNVPCALNTIVMIANQLNTTNNTINSLIPAPPVGSLFYKWLGYWKQYQFDPDDSVWLPDGDATLNPGEAGLFKAAATTTLTFVGEVEQGALSNPLSSGVNIVRSSMVPQAGLVSTDLNFPAEVGDLAYKWLGYWKQHQYDPDDSVWLPEEPTFGVGEGMIIKKALSSTISAWVRNFTVGP
jgi:hypothetical protein